MRWECVKEVFGWVAVEKMTCSEGKQSRRQQIGTVRHLLGHHPANYKQIVYIHQI